MKIVIRIYSEIQKSTKTFSDSQGLAASWSDTIFNIELGKVHAVEHDPRTIHIDGESLGEQLEQIIFSLNKNDEVLILPLFGKDVVFDFIQRIEEESEMPKCAAIYDNFSRYTFLEGTQDLSLNIPKDTEKWISELLSEYGLNQIIHSLDCLDKEIFVLGETIIDEYIFCNALGKVSKDPLIAFEIQTRPFIIWTFLVWISNIGKAGSRLKIRR